MKLLKLVIIVAILIITGLLLYAQHTHQDKPIMSLTFDDGYEEHYAIAFPLLEKNGVKATEYIIAGRIDSEFEGTPTMNLEEIKILQAAGWEIGSHSMTHQYLTKLSNNELEKELRDSKHILELNKINVKSMSLPYGDFNEKVITEAKKYYQYIRTSINGYNPIFNANRYELKSIAIDNTTTIKEIESLIDYAKDNRVWLILMFHLVRTEKSSEFSEYIISPSDLDSLISYALEQGIEIKTISEVLDEK